MRYLDDFIKYCDLNREDWYAAFDDKQITYSDFIKIVCHIIPLIKKFSQNNTFVCIKSDKSLYTTCFFFAAHLLNKTYVPISADIPISREKFILKTLNLKNSIVEKDFIEEIESFCKKVCYEKSLKNVLDHLTLLPEYNEEQLAYILFTSGSTGQPKGVQISYKNLNSFINWATNEYKITNNDIFLNQVPFTFDLSVLDIYSSFTKKSKLVLCDKSTSSDFNKISLLIENYDANIIYSTPSLLQLLSYSSHFKRKSASKLKKILFCGERLSKKLAQKYMEICPEADLYNLYGPTETNVVTSVHVTKDVIRMDEIPIGKAMSDYFLSVVGIEGELVENGLEGELVVSGDSVACGYINDPLKTQNSFTCIPTVSQAISYRTGDLVIKRDDYFYYRGRSDHQFKFMGYRIEAGEIESALNSFNYVKNSLILPLIDKAGSVYGILAAIEVKDMTPNTKELKAVLATKLPAYMIPTKFINFDAFPNTSHGKIDRNAILKEALNGN